MRQPFVYIEIDIDYAGPVKTLRICPPVTGVPVGELFFPCLTDVSLRSGSVNIGGADDELSAFGERAELKFTVQDFAYHDRFFANYEATQVVSGGTLWSRLIARWPAFSGSACRYVEAYLDNGVITVANTKNYILREVKKGRGRRYTWTALDPTDLAANDNALCPAPSSGVLFDEVQIGDGTATLSPVGIGDEEYPASGRALIGSEYTAFTRVGDVLTFTERGFKGTTESGHSAGTTVQVAAFYEQATLDAVASDQLLNYAMMDPSQIPTATWAAERQRWAPNRKITTDIVKPTPVDKIMGWISQIGCSFWWNDVAQQVGFKTIRPPDGDTVFRLTDDDVKELEIETRDERRITEILFSTVQKSVNDDPDRYESYERHSLIVDGPATTLHKSRRRLEVNNPLLNQGADIAVTQIGKRLLKRRSTAPTRYKLLLDAKDDAIGLTDVIELTSDEIQNIFGEPIATQMQVVRRDEVRNGHDFEVTCQAYEYAGRLAYIAPAGTTTYDLATEEERERYAFIADRNTGQMSDGSPAYVII